MAYHKVSATVLEAGIDWISASTIGGEQSEQLGLVARQLTQDAILEGNAIRPWGMAGFHGFKAGSVQYGIRDDEVLIRLSSHMAFQHWKTIVQISDNVSRLDVQTTMRYSEDPNAVIARHYRQAKRNNAIASGNQTLSLFSSNRGPSTIYFNKRISDRFGRIYNKHAESGDEHYENCVRYEIELKRHVAHNTAAALAVSSNVAHTSFDCVFAFMAKRGISLKSERDSPLGKPDHLSLQRPYIHGGSSPGISECSRSSQWLATCIKPTVGRVISYVGVEELLKILGLDQVAQPVRTSPESTRLDAEWSM